MRPGGSFSRAMSPARIALTASSTRAFSETTWRHRLRTTGGSSAKKRASSSGVTSRRARTPGRRAARSRTPSSHSARRLLYSDEASEWWTPLFRHHDPEPRRDLHRLVRQRPAVEQQSAAAGSPNVEAIWSMIPQATPTNPFSASRANLRDLQRRQLEPAERSQHERRRDLVRRRGAQSRAARDVAGDDRLAGRDVDPAAGRAPRPPP